MTKKWIALPVAAVVAVGLVACNDMGSFTAPDELDIKAAQPNTNVSAMFTIDGSGEAVWQNYPDAPRNVPNGHYNTECDVNGRYYSTNQHGGGASWTDPHHQRCGELVGGGEDMDVVLTGIVVNYVQPRSGNIHLNFTVCGYYEDEETGEWIQDCDAKAYVHYQHNRDSTDGSGVVLGTDEDGNDWLVFLGSVGHPGNEQMLAKELEGVTARRLDGSIEVTSAVLCWDEGCEEGEVEE